jgi:hypothetical protein
MDADARRRTRGEAGTPCGFPGIGAPRSRVVFSSLLEAV